MKSPAAMVCLSLAILILPLRSTASRYFHPLRGVVERVSTELREAMRGFGRGVLTLSFSPLEKESMPFRARAQAAEGLGSAGPPRQGAASPAKRPFVLFAPTRWRPGVPLPGEWPEKLAYGLFVAAPLVSVGLLTVFIRRVKRSKLPTGWGRLIAGNTLVLCCLVTPVLLAGETYYRFVYDTTDSLAYTRVSERWEMRHWRLNNVGCRDNVPYAPTLTPGKRRISFVGDSFTAGHGISDVEDRFPNLLRRAHPDWEVHVVAKVVLFLASDDAAHINGVAVPVDGGSISA